MKTVKCMVCPNEIDMEATEDIPQAWVDLVAVRQHNWALASGKYGYFICCPECYPKVFDKSKGGSVGFLKKEFEKFAIPKRED